MAAIASLSASVKSTPFVWAPSRRVVSKRYTRSRAMVSSRQSVDNIQGNQDGGGQHRIFEHDVVQPMMRKRRVGSGHETSRLAASCLCSVVLASHSSPIETEFRC